MDPAPVTSGDGARHTDEVGRTRRGTGAGRDVTPRRRPRPTEPLVLALLTAAAAAAVAAAAPPAGDAPAHLYRSLLLDRGVWVWDTLWYGGHYPFLSYSVLYYPLASVGGHEPLTVAAVAWSSGLFASLVIDEWGDAARWSARGFAVFAVAPLLSGTYSYAAALAAALFTLWAVRRHRPAWAAIGAAATLGLSVLAFAFLVLGLAAAAAARRHPLRLASRHVPVLVTVVALCGLQLVLLAWFPSPGRYPYPGWQLALVLLVSSLALALAANARSRFLVVLIALWALANVGSFLVASPVGSNVLRLRSLVFALMLLAAALARWRPRPVAAAFVIAGFAYSVGPQLMAVRAIVRHSAEAEAAFWSPTVTYLRARLRPGERVEVVPTRAHWEAYWLPREGIPLARGWFRQLDMVANDAFYDADLDPVTYRRWLDDMAVRYVVVVDTDTSGFGADTEARVLRSTPGVRRVRARAGVAVYEVDHPTPPLTGPGPARISSMGHEHVAGWVGRAGTYRLALRHTPQWRVRDGRACVERAADGMIRLVVTTPGPFRLEVARGLAAAVRSPSRGPCPAP